MRFSTQSFCISPETSTTKQQLILRTPKYTSNKYRTPRSCRFFYDDADINRDIIGKMPSPANTSLLPPVVTRPDFYHNSSDSILVLIDIRMPGQMVLNVYNWRHDEPAVLVILTACLWRAIR